MKTLYIMRHAKSDQNGQDDHERPLNARGKQARVQMAEYLQRENLIPAHILCSTARRTKETAAALISALPASTQVDYVQKLYMATPGEIIAELHRLDDSIDSALIIAHNPGVHNLSLLLASTASRAEDVAALKINFPTAALAVLSLPIPSWKNLAPGCANLERFVAPRMLG